MSKKNINNMYSSLADLYHIEYLSTDQLRNQNIGYDAETLSSFKYGLCLYKDQNQLIGVVMLSNDSSINYNEKFSYYLSCMENVSLDSVSLLIVYLMHSDYLIENPFKTRENYPSIFAQNYLKNTFGFIVYKFQLIELLKASLPYSHHNANHINSFIKSFNQKKHNTYNEFRNLILPDNYNLFELLRENTPLGSNNNDIGIVVDPDYRLTYNLYLNFNSSI
jgi:hypothetical protein